MGMVGSDEPQTPFDVLHDSQRVLSESRQRQCRKRRVIVKTSHPSSPSPGLTSRHLAGRELRVAMRRNDHVRCMHA